VSLCSMQSSQPTWANSRPQDFLNLPAARDACHSMWQLLMSVPSAFLQHLLLFACNATLESGLPIAVQLSQCCVVFSVCIPVYTTVRKLPYCTALLHPACCRYFRPMMLPSEMRCGRHCEHHVSVLASSITPCSYSCRCMDSLGVITVQ
jgi:hypothetical protein